MQRALYARIPTSEAEKLDRAAFELQATKQDIITALVSTYVDPATPAGLDSLRQLTGGGRRVVVEASDDTLAVGRHSFRPYEEQEVLTLEQVAELLHAGSATVRKLAEAGQLPGRKLGKEWRFSRRAVIDWLASGDGDKD